MPSRFREPDSAAEATQSVSGDASGARARGELGAGALSVGDLLGQRFVILRYLGEGSSGRVFEANDQATQRRVAVKLLSRLGPEAILRIKQEARELSTFAHPNLVAFYDLVAHQGDWLFTMECVDGAPFASALRASPDRCDLERLASALDQLARGVLALHARGRVHCDLKSSNVLVQRDGRVVIIDLGLVRVTATDATEHGFAGTPAYAAPEQMQGEETGPAGDWYAVGVMLYEALTGTLPFAGRPRELLEAKLAREYLPVSALWPGVSPELERLCHGLLDPVVASRFDGNAIIAVVSEPVGLVPAEPEARAASRLFGREVALGALAEAFSNMEREHVTSVLVHGASGIGKTLLVQRFVEQAAQGRDLLVLSSRCYPHEQLPFQALDAIVDGLARYLRRLPTARAAGLLSPDVHLLAHMFPVLRTVDALRQLPRPLNVAELGDHELRTRGARSMAALLEAIGYDLPIVLLIDDVHAGTADGLLLLGLVFEHFSRGRVLWLMTAHQPIYLSGSGVDHRQLEVGPLSNDAADALARELLGSADATKLAREIAHESHGHPLHVRELAERARTTGRPSALSLGDALAAKLASLPELEQSIMHVLALAGQPIERRVLLEAVGGAELSHLRILANMQLLRPVVRSDGSLAYEPHHDQIRLAALDRLDLSRRRGLHERLAEAYMAVGPADLTPAVGHYLEADRAHDAARLAAQAAQKALDALAFHRAADMLAIASAHTVDSAQRAALEDRASEVFAGVGRHVEAAQLFVKRAARAQPEQAFDLERRAMMSEFFAGEYRRGKALLERLARQVGLSFPRSSVSLVVRSCVLGLRTMVFGLPRLVAGSERVNLRDRQRGSLAWSCMAIQMNDAYRTLYYGLVTLFATARAGQASEYAVAAVGWCTAIVAAFGYVPRQTSALVAFGTGLAGETPVRVWIYAVLGLLRLQQGEVELGSAALGKAAEMPEEPGQPSARHFARAGLLVLLFWRGHARELSAHASQWVRDAERVGDALYGPFMRFAASAEHLVRDDVPAARAQVASVKALPAWSTHPGRVDVWWEIWVELYAGDNANAHALAQQLPWTRTFELPHLNYAVGLFVRGQAAAAVIKTQPSALAELCRARRRLAAVRHRWAPALAQLLWATEELASGNRTRAVERLTRAEEQLLGLGLEGFAAAASARRAVLIGGTVGRELEAQAQARLAALGLAQAPWLSVLAPGFAA